VCKNCVLFKGKIKKERMKKMKIAKNGFAVIALILVVALIGTVSYGVYQKVSFTKAENPIATMEVEGYGTIKIELYPDQAPETVANFIKLSNNGFYDGLKFYRVISGFMIQSGDPNNDGTGSPKLSDIGLAEDENDDSEYSIKGEFIANGVNNTIRHEAGVISMARADYTSYSSSLTEESYNSAGSSFFIVTGDSENVSASLDEEYAAFGKVIEGMDVVRAIEAVEVESSDDDSSSSSEESTPVEDIVITSIRVETNGVDYGTPETYDVFNYYNWLYQQYGINLSY
jgi:peptidyl-prolyl cis-trans isomerase B (cyclophilin B)